MEVSTGTNPQALTVAVEFQVRLESVSRSEWVEAWRGRAADALRNEPKTTSYEAAVALDDESRVLIFERYEEGQQTLDDHMSRPAHKNLLATMEAGRMTQRRPWIALGSEVDRWHSKPTSNHDEAISSAGYAILISGFRCPDPPRFVQSSRVHAEEIVAPSSGALLCGTSRITLDDHHEVDLAVGDYVVASVFDSPGSLASYQGGRAWKHLAGEVEQSGGELLFSRGYSTTGAGFVWKGNPPDQI